MDIDIGTVRNRISEHIPDPEPDIAFIDYLKSENDFLWSNIVLWLKGAIGEDQFRATLQSHPNHPDNRK